MISLWYLFAISMKRIFQSAGEYALFVPVDTDLAILVIMIGVCCCRYWEVVETGQRLMLTGVLVLVKQGSLFQVIFAMAVTLCFLKLNQIQRPYANFAVGSTKEMTLWQILLLYFMVMLVKVDYEGTKSDALVVAVILIMFANVIFDVGRLVVHSYTQRNLLARNEKSLQSEPAATLSGLHHHHSGNIPTSSHVNSRNEIKMKTGGEEAGLSQINTSNSLAFPAIAHPHHGLMNVGDDSAGMLEV
jgi:hypothetical protein